MGGITYDTTVLIAAERGDRQMWSRHADAAQAVAASKQGHARGKVVITVP